MRTTEQWYQRYIELDMKYEDNETAVKQLVKEIQDEK